MVTKDLILQYKNTRYQLLPSNGYHYTLRRAKVTVEEKQDGTVTFRYKDRTISWAIAQQEVKRTTSAQVVSAKAFQERRVYIPGPNHPWRRGFMVA